MQLMGILVWEASWNTRSSCHQGSPNTQNMRSWTTSLRTQPETHMDAVTSDLLTESTRIVLALGDRDESKGDSKVNLYCPSAIQIFPKLNAPDWRFAVAIRVKDWFVMKLIPSHEYGWNGGDTNSTFNATFFQSISVCKKSHLARVQFLF